MCNLISSPDKKIQSKLTKYDFLNFDPFLRVNLSRILLETARVHNRKKNNKEKNPFDCTGSAYSRWWCATRRSRWASREYRKRLIRRCRIWGIIRAARRDNWENPWSEVSMSPARPYWRIWRVGVFKITSNTGNSRKTPNKIAETRISRFNEKKTKTNNFSIVPCILKFHRYPIWQKVSLD